MIKFLTIGLVIGAILFAVPHTIQANEIYLVNDRPVLLYKLVNWWYTCLETETQMICGAPLTFQSREEIQVAYDNQTRQLDLLLPKGVLTQLSLFKPADFPGNPGSLKLLWQNPKFFPKGKGTTLSPCLTSLDQLYATRMPRAEADLIKGIEHLLTFLIQGSIQGLINHKIALHPMPDQTANNRPDQDLIRSCSHGAKPLSFSIIHGQSLEVLARYEMVWE